MITISPVKGGGQMYLQDLFRFDCTYARSLSPSGPPWRRRARVQLLYFW